MSFLGHSPISCLVVFLWRCSHNSKIHLVSAMLLLPIGMTRKEETASDKPKYKTQCEDINERLLSVPTGTRGIVWCWPAQMNKMWGPYPLRHLQSCLIQRKHALFIGSLLSKVSSYFLQNFPQLTFISSSHSFTLSLTHKQGGAHSFLCLQTFSLLFK